MLTVSKISSEKTYMLNNTFLIFLVDFLLILFVLFIINKKIRNKLCEFLQKELTYEEVFLIFENDLNLTKIDIRQVEFKDNYVYLLKGKNLIYQIDSYKQGSQNWEIGYITNIVEKYPNWSDCSEKIEIHNNIRYIKKSKINSQKNDDFFNWNIVVNQFDKNRILTDKEKNACKV